MTTQVRLLTSQSVSPTVSLLPSVKFTLFAPAFAFSDFHCKSLRNTSFFTARLTINVLDVNDNAPRFRPYGVTNFTEKILEGAQPGTTLLSVSAVDPDKGPNGLVIYQLLHLPRGGYVRLEDPSTGMTLCACFLLPSTLTGFDCYASREAIA